MIDALFERTVDIVQSLPKTGPIQTSYEEKLALYSLYKQATEGDVRSKRPGMLDMLGRAKWDAWSNRRGLSSQDAKQLYVESMLKTLRKFSDRPQAMALIEELESFSGDVAQRVMSASLARADSDSEASSASLSPRFTTQRLPPGSGAGTYEAEEDERDAISQLPRTSAAQASSRGATGQRHLGSTNTSTAAGLRSGQRTPMSVEGASAMAVRGGGPGGPQSSMGGSDDEGEDDVGHTAAADARRPSLQTGRGPGGSQQQHRPGQAGRPGQQPWQRGSGSLSGHLASGEGRLYAVPNAARYPGPPASDAAGGFGGGAGASLYSAVGPSRPTPSEQHFYHHHGAGLHGEGTTAAGSTRPYAPSSIGGRSGGQHQQRGYGSAANAAARADVDLALQSIQASLAGLHERMNHVEGRSGRGRAGGGGGGSSSSLLGNGPLAAGYRAVADALHDIAVLLGLRSDGRGGVAPSSYRGDGAESVGSRGTAAAAARRGAAAGAGGTPGRPGWTAIVRLFVALVQLGLRLALDMTSVVVVVSLLLLIVKRTTGRGDPLLLLRLLRRWSGVRAAGRPTIQPGGTP